jgi:hypothetical protein
MVLIHFHCISLDNSRYQTFILSVYFLVDIIFYSLEIIYNLLE